MSSALLYSAQHQTFRVRGFPCCRTAFAFTDRKLAKLTDGTIYASAGVSKGSGAVSTTVLATVVAEASTSWASGGWAARGALQRKGLGAGQHSPDANAAGARRIACGGTCEATSIAPNQQQLTAASLPLQILTSRAVDRSVRALFPRDWLDDTEVTVTLHTYGDSSRSFAPVGVADTRVSLRIDQETDVTVLAINAASSALSRSDLPWQGPCGAVRVARLNGEFVMNPTQSELHSAGCEFDLLVGTREKVVRMEAGAHRGSIPRPVLLEAVDAGTAAIQPLLDHQLETAAEAGNTGSKRGTSLSSPERLQELHESASMLCGDEFRAVYGDASHTKLSRKDAIAAVRERARRILFQQTQNRAEAAWVLNQIEREALRAALVHPEGPGGGLRCDGHGVEEVRPLSAEVGIFPGLHGSGVFSRGNTLSASKPMAPGTWDCGRKASRVAEVVVAKQVPLSLRRPLG